MNKERRTEIDKAIGLLQEIASKWDEAKTLIESAKDGEREYVDNMPENMQQGDKGEQAESAAVKLEEAFDAMDGVDLYDLIIGLEEAKE